MTVAGVPALHCKASPLPFSLLAHSRRLLLSPGGETGVDGGEGERRMDGWFAEGACIFIAEVWHLCSHMGIGNTRSSLHPRGLE